MKIYCQVIEYLGQVTKKSNINIKANLFLFEFIIENEQETINLEGIVFIHETDSYVTIEEEYKNIIDTNKLLQSVIQTYTLEKLLNYENK